MSEHQPYKLDHAKTAKEQVLAIAGYAKRIKRSAVLGRILRKALHHLQVDPQEWGEPEYQSKYVDALYCHAIIRPVAFRFVIYQQVRGVVLLSVRFFADFD